MDSKYNALFTPWKIGKVEIPNRIVQCSMGGTSLFGWMEPCHLDKEAAYFLLNRAKDGVGLILPGMQCIKDAIGGRWLYQNDKMFKDLKVYMEEFHKTGAKLFVQLAAGMGRSMAITKPMVMLLEHPLLGKLVSPVADLDYITASASATPNRWYDEVKSRPMTIKEIQDQVEAFAKTSKKLMDAGVDGVEIHAVHEGYLLDQFTISNMNYRTDQYGGSFENRFRFPVEIVQTAASHTFRHQLTTPAGNQLRQIVLRFQFPVPVQQLVDLPTRCQQFGADLVRFADVSNQRLNRFKRFTITRHVHQVKHRLR